MFCTRCGAQMEDGSKFCTECGAPLEPVANGASVPSPDASAPVTPPAPTRAAAPAPQPRPNPAPAPDMPVMAVPSPQRQPAYPERRRGMGPAGVVAVVASAVAVVAVAVAVYLVVSPGRQQEEAQPAQTTAAASASTPAPASPASPATPQSSGDKTTVIVVPQAVPVSPTGGSSTTYQSDSYILPSSASADYSASDLSGLSDWQLYVARNEVYARHGRGFSNADLRAYFSSQSWYHEVYTPEEWESMPNQLNDHEINNVNTIADLERSRGSSYAPKQQ